MTKGALLAFFVVLLLGLIGCSSLSNPRSLDGFQGRKEYQDSYETWLDLDAYKALPVGRGRIEISLSKQRALLMDGNQVVIDYPITSGKEGYETPVGTYQVLEKIKDKRSSLYGVITNSTGQVTAGGIDIRKYQLKPGEYFKGTLMPYWMRMSDDGIGHHVGNISRSPLSHACVRGQKEIMALVYAKMEVGSEIKVVR